MPNVISCPYQLDEWSIHFKFKSCWVVINNFIQILKVHSVRKQYRTWTEATEWGVWSGFALFADVP